MPLQAATLQTLVLLLEVDPARSAFDPDPEVTEQSLDPDTGFASRVWFDGYGQN